MVVLGGDGDGVDGGGGGSGVCSGGSGSGGVGGVWIVETDVRPQWNPQPSPPHQLPQTSRPVQRPHSRQS